MEVVNTYVEIFDAVHEVFLGAGIGDLPFFELRFLSVLIQSV